MGKRSLKLSQEKKLKKQQAFLEAFVRLGTITHAAEAAKVDRRTHYDWLEPENDPDGEYAEAFEAAKEAAFDLLQREAIRRAVEGVEEPTGWYKGQAGGMVRKYSDTLLIFLMKGARPETYRDNVKVSGDSSAPLEFVVRYEDPPKEPKP